MKKFLIFLAFPVYTVGVSAFFLWLSADLRWTQGWVFCVCFAVAMGAPMAWLVLKDPALLMERMRMPGTAGQSRADALILMGIKVVGLAWLVLPALDHRYGWSPRLPLWCQGCGVILLLAGNFFMFRSFTDNTFASQVVRIQTDRKQHVVDTGVYGLVRHPMYLGINLMCLGSGLLLSSAAGVGVTLLMIALFAVRIFGEEQVLVTGLEGYRAYRLKVRFRLVPHVW